MRSLGLVAVAAGAMLALPLGDRVVANPGDALRLSVAGRPSAAPTIAALGDVVAVAWHAASPGSGGDVFTAVSRDGGVSFAAPVQVNDVSGESRSGGELPPRVVLGPGRAGGDPDLSIVWRARSERTSIRLSRSRDGGRTFGAAATLQSAEAPGERGWHSAAVASDGHLHTLWLDHRGLAPPPGAPPHVHGAHRSDADGVAMAQKSALYYAAPGSQGAAERELARGVCYCCKTALAAGKDGRLYAAWRHVYPGNIRDIAFISSRDGGRSFAAPTRVSEDGWQIAGCPDDGPAIAVGFGERVHVVWPTVLKDPEPRGALFYAATNDGQTFTERLRIPTLGSPKPTHPQIAIDVSGRIVVAWDEVVDGTRRAAMTVMRVTPAGGVSFDRPTLLDAAGPASVYPVLAMVGPRVLAAWTSGAGDSASIAVRRIDLSPTASR